MNLRSLKKLYNSHSIKNPHYIMQLKNKGNSKSIFSFLYRLKYYSIIKKCNSYIPIKTAFANEPSFPHSIFGIFISSGAKIGENCVIFHQVTIGSNTLQDSKGYGSPEIGNNVYIGCGAKIIGNVRIGNNVRIGANCIVTTDVPDNCTIVMPKPLIIEHEEPLDNTFIPFSNDTN